MADLESSRTLGKAGAAETARLAKLKDDGASLLETRKALLGGVEVAHGSVNSRSRSYSAVLLAEPIVSTGKIAKIQRKKVIAKVATSVKPLQAGGKRKSQALADAWASPVSGISENELDQGGLVEEPVTVSSLRRGTLLSSEIVRDQGGPVEMPVTVSSLRRGNSHVPISGGGANLSSLASGPSGLLSEVEEIPLPHMAIIESEMDTCALIYLNLKRNEHELIEIIDESGNNPSDELAMKWATALSIISSLMVQSSLYLQVGHLIVHFDKKLMGEFSTLHKALRRCYVVIDVSVDGGLIKMQCITEGDFAGRFFELPINNKFVLVATRSFMIHKVINFDFSFGSTPTFHYPSIADCHLGMISTRVRAEAQARAALKESDQSLRLVQDSIDEVHIVNPSLTDSRSSMLSSSFATDAAVAAKAAASASNLVANMRAYKFLFIIQLGHGENGLEKTSSFEFLFGDPKVPLKCDDVKAKVYALAMRGNHQNILSLAVFSKFSAFCKGEFGSEKQYKDSTCLLYTSDAADE